MRENGPLLSRVVDPPGTKGGLRAGNFPGPPKNIFCPGWSRTRDKRPFCPGTTRDKRAFCPGSWLHPGQKIFFGRAGKIPSLRPTFSPGWIYHPRQNGPVFPRSRLILCLFLFLFTSLLKLAFIC